MLATLDDWSDAGEAITLALPEDYALPQLLNVCRERISRGEAEERERLEELRSRLLDAARRAAYITDPEAGLRQLMDSLRALAGSAATLETVEALLNRREAKSPAGALSDGGLRDQQERRHG